MQAKKCSPQKRFANTSNLHIFPFNYNFQIIFDIFQFVNSVIILPQDRFKDFCDPTKNSCI